ncbi:MAG: type II toxin-antitoxin system VapC family toxin [Fibrobacterota bacterium]
MKYLLDTNICIYLIKRKSPEIIHELEKVGFENVYLSTITVAELEYGVANSCRQQEAQIALLEFILSFTVLDFTQSSANCYGRIRKEVKDKGEPIGEMDSLPRLHWQTISRLLRTMSVSLQEYQIYT